MNHNIQYVWAGAPQVQRAVVPQPAGLRIVCEIHGEGVPYLILALTQPATAENTNFYCLRCIDPFTLDALLQAAGLSPLKPWPADCGEQRM